MSSYFEPDRFSVEIFDVKVYGASGNGVINDTTALQRALTAAGVSGGIVFIPQGTYLFTSPLAVPTDVIVRGAGMRKSILTTTAAGDGLTSIYAINSTSRAHVLIEDLKIVSTNGASTGAGIDQVSGTPFFVHRVYVSGFKYSIIFDQTELGEIDECYLEFPLTAGLWLTNGADHTAGGLTQVTNRISIKRTQFNLNPGTWGVIDDGGIDHSFEDCNFNGGLSHMRIAGLATGHVSDCEWEGGTSSNIVCAITTFNSGAAVSAANGLTIQANNMSPAVGSPCIVALNNQTLTLIGNGFNASGITAVTGAAGVNGLISFGNSTGAGGPKILDAEPSSLLFYPGLFNGAVGESFQAFGIGLPGIRTRSLVVANNGVAQVAHAAGGTPIATLNIVDDSGNGASWLVQGALAAVVKIGGTAVYTVTKGTAASTNIYWDGGNNRYEIQNLTGAQRTYSIVENTVG